MNFEDCIERGSIKQGFNLGYKIDDAIKSAEEFINIADQNYKIEQYKGSHIMAYLSMFHSARALLYSKDYLEHSHIGLVIALKELFKDNKIILVHLNLLNRIRTEREGVQYQGEDVSQGEAELVIINAKDFFKAVKTYLNIK